MELKEAFEAATEHVDVRSGFLGDVMTGARKRRTRKLLVTTAVVALLAGGVAGGLLTRSQAPEEVQPADQRFATPTRGDLAHDELFLQQSLKAWRDSPKPPALKANGPMHVYWAGTTPAGETAVVLQQEPTDHEWATTVAVVVNGGVAVHESQTDDYQQGAFRLGDDKSVYLVMARSVPIQYSMRATRDANGKHSRHWQPLSTKDGVGVVTAAPGDEPAFVPLEKTPAPEDFSLDGKLLHVQEKVEQRAFVPHVGLGWNERKLATASPAYSPGGQDIVKLYEHLHREGFVDYQVGPVSSSQWSVVAALPDGRSALVTEYDNRVFAGLYRPDGALERTAVGHEIDKTKPVPIRFVLPDDQGILLADFGATINDASDAWLAPQGTTEVQLKRGDTITTVVL